MYKKIIISVISIALCFLWGSTAKAVSDDHPLIANYYLDELQSSPSFTTKMAKYDLLILTPAQMKAHPSVVAQIRAKNREIIILAYIPIQSYNTAYWGQDPIFRYLTVQENWWLRSSAGSPIYIWPSLKGINMSEDWSRYLVGFINTYMIEKIDMDGVFFDMVSHNISWANNGDIDLDENGQRDSALTIDNEWLKRTTFFLKYAQEQLDTRYIVMNGSSHDALQPYVNGRMFETFPTPWEGNGTWPTIMNNLVKNQKQNDQPYITILNTNTHNTGNQYNYQQMRFGLGSALLENAYSSFDHGDQDHGQTWWYDEYDIDLGAPIDDSSSKSGVKEYVYDIWTRPFENGLVVLNSTNQKQHVELDGEYELIHGTQDPLANSGDIVSEIFLNYYDSRILLKTFDTLKDIIFPNGSFVRFFRPDGSRVRNGFFIFDEKERGGDRIAYIDLNGDGKRDYFVATKNSFRAYKHDGRPMMKRKYPFPYYEGEVTFHVADVNKDRHMEVYATPGAGDTLPIRIYTYDGIQKHRDWYPFGEGYTGGYSLAVAKNKSFVKNNRLVIAGGVGYAPKVHVYTYRPYTLEHTWLPYEASYTGGINVAAGDVDGDGWDEIIVGAGKGKKPEISVFSIDGTRISGPFVAYESFLKEGIDVRAVDVDFDGKDDIIGLSSGI
ncbi:VCBS repeat-containing protein [Patescibacteria group bacterium]|nr:VCBS repeat-containing protein [Patescibacteria group bacterium]MBU1721849.1 VCBS repeat-containing protein [Patescibacteria group bacterium]MBU1901656.1 VCBS repeat-containing protein [Patescibacteria group bacterium]